MTRLAGGRVLVAGGGGALGGAVATAIAAAGGLPVLLDRHFAAGASPDWPRAEVDLTDAAALEAALDAIFAGDPPISGAVQAAGLIRSAPLVSLLAPPGRRGHPLALWREVHDANLTATFLFGRGVAERWAAARTRGALVTIGSIAAGGNSGQGAYAAAKAGVEASTRAWARELGPLGIRFVTVAPGFIDTPATHAALSPTALARVVAETPLRRLGRPDEVADAVVFALASGFVTGTVIEVAGGLTL